MEDRLGAVGPPSSARSPAKNKKIIFFVQLLDSLPAGGGPDVGLAHRLHGLQRRERRRAPQADPPRPFPRRREAERRPERVRFLRGEPPQRLVPREQRAQRRRRPRPRGPGGARGSERQGRRGAPAAPARRDGATRPEDRRAPPQTPPPAPPRRGGEKPAPPAHAPCTRPLGARRREARRSAAAP